MSLPISTSKCHCVPNAQLLNFSFILSLSLTPKVIYLIFGGKRNCQSWDLKSFPHTDLVFINYEIWIGMATGRSPVRKNSPYHLCLEGDIEKSREDNTWWRLILFYSRHREDSVVSHWLTSWIPSLWGQGETVRGSMVIPSSDYRHQHLFPVDKWSHPGIGSSVEKVSSKTEQQAFKGSLCK